MQIIPSFRMGGAEVMCKMLSLELFNLGHEIIVVSLYSCETHLTEELQNRGIKIYFLNKKTGLDLKVVKELKKIFKQEKPDVIHSHINAGIYAMVASLNCKIKHKIHTIHNLANKDQSGISKLITKFFVKHKNYTLVALSDLIQISISNYYNLNKESIPIVLNGINLDNCIVKQNYKKDDCFKILHIGRFMEQKNHIGLLESFKIFHAKHKDSELFLIGDGEKKQEIENYICENGLNSSIKLLGLQDNVYGFLNKADIFTLPSNYEGIPMTLIEAMGTGLPIVATNVGGVADMLTNDLNALLVNVNVEEISNAFEKYYLNEELRAEHGKNALKRSVNFSSKQMAEKYLQIYLK